MTAPNPFDQKEPEAPVAPQPPVPPTQPLPPETPPISQPPPPSEPPFEKEEKPAFLKRIPFKTILFILVALLIVGGGVFALTRFLGKEPFGVVTLTWWGLWEDETTNQPLIDEYQKQNPTIKITYVRQSSQDYRERLTSSLARGSGPDIFRFHNTWVPMLAGELATLPPEVMDASEFSKRFYPVATNDLTYKGRLVGVPLMIDGLGLYINEAIFRGAGLVPPTTWDDLRKTALSLTLKDEGDNIRQAGVALGTAGNVDHWQDILSLMMLQNGADPANPTGKRAEDALSFYTIFVATDKVWDGSLPPSTTAFAAGRLAMYFGPSWRVFEIKKQNPTLSFRIVPVPQLPKSTPQEPDITWASYWVEGVWARGKNSKEAWKFLKFMSERETLEKFYANAAKTRLFGEVYPRPDMAELLRDDPFVGAFIKQASVSRSWYLASQTKDGPTGINSRISKYFEDAVNKVLKGNSPKEALKTVEQGVSQVLSSYGTR